MPTTFPPNTYGNTIVTTSGILHYMRLDGSNATISDDADSLTGTASGVTYRHAGALEGDDSRSMYFNGSSSYINFGNNILLSGKFSIELWIKPSRVTGAQTFASKENYVGAWSGWTWWLNGAVPIFSRLAGVNTRYTVSGSSLAVNQWAHLAVTCDGVTLRMYKNGVLIDSASAGTVYTSAYVCLLGAATNGQVADRYDHFQGYIDEFAVYNAALSTATVLAHYNRGITAPITNLYDTASTTGFLGGTAARTAMATTRARTETVTVRVGEEVSFFLTSSATETLPFGIVESALVEAAFGGIKHNLVEDAVLGGAENILIEAIIENDEENFVYSSEEAELLGYINTNEIALVKNDDLGAVQPLFDVSLDYQGIIKRRQGFIHFAAQRLFNGDLSIEYKHSKYVPLRQRYNGALGNFVLGVSKLDDEQQSHYMASDLYFLVRNEYGLPVALGQAITDWTSGTVLVDFFENMDEHKNVLKTFGVFPSTTG